MAYQQGKTIVKQSAVKAASEIVGAAMAGGLIQSFDEGVDKFNTLRDDIYAELVPLVDEDNKVYQAQPATAKRQYAPRPGGGGGGQVKAEDALGTAMKYGKFIGKTLAEVLACDEDACLGLGYGTVERPKTGIDYITWLAENPDKNTFMSSRAQAVLEHLKDQAE